LLPPLRPGSRTSDPSLIVCVCIPDVSSVLIPLAVTVVSAPAFYVSIYLGTFWPAAWLAPLPVLWLASRVSWWKASLAALTAFYIGELNISRMLLDVAPVWLVALAFLMLALPFVLAMLAGHLAMLRLPGAVAPFACPAAWVAYAFLWSLVSVHGTSLDLAYSQTDVLPLLQIVSITGIWGILFALMLAPSAVGVALMRRSYASLIPALAISAGVSE